MRRYGDDPRAVASAALYCLLGRGTGAVDLLNQAVKRNKAFYGIPLSTARLSKGLRPG